MNMNNQNKKNKQKQSNGEYYDPALLSSVKYVKILYSGTDGEIKELSTDVKFIGDKLISLYSSAKEDFNRVYPQEIILKFITDDAVYVAKSILKEFKIINELFYYYVSPPERIIKQQLRKYNRVNLRRTCILVVSDNRGIDTAYLSKSVNISASGILLNELETMFDKNFVEIELSKYDCYHIVICLENDLVFKLFARFVRHDNVNGMHRYAFNFLNMKNDEILALDKYLTKPRA